MRLKVNYPTQKKYCEALLRFFIGAMKFTAFYQEPKKNLANFEDRFEAATRRNNENLEKLADAAQAARDVRH